MWTCCALLFLSLLVTVSAAVIVKESESAFREVDGEAERKATLDECVRAQMKTIPAMIGYNAKTTECQRFVKSKLQPKTESDVKFYFVMPRDADVCKKSDDVLSALVSRCRKGSHEFKLNGKTICYKFILPKEPYRMSDDLCKGYGKTAKIMSQAEHEAIQKAMKEEDIFQLVLGLVQNVETGKWSWLGESELTFQALDDTGITVNGEPDAVQVIEDEGAKWRLAGNLMKEGIVEPDSETTRYICQMELEN